MDIEKIMNKLDTYIRGYSKILEENNLLKKQLEEEKKEKEKIIATINEYNLIVENSKQSVKSAIEKVIKANSQFEEYEEKVNIIFEGLNDILESMIKEESISIEELEQLKQGIEKLKDNLNKPTNE